MFSLKDLPDRVRNADPSGSFSRARFGSFEVDFSQREVRKHGVRIRLQHKPFQILELLLLRAGQLITRKEFAHRLWPDSHVSFERGLNTAMNMLRQSLGDSAPDSRFIETRPGLGYRFIPPVELIAEKTPSRKLGTDDDCLKGSYFLDKMTEEHARKAAAHFEAALQQGAACVAAHAGLVDTYCQMAEWGLMPTAAAAVRAREHAIAAVSADSNNAASHAAMGRVRGVFDEDWKRGCECFKRALELNAVLPSAHRGYAATLCASGDNARALKHIQIACALEPLSLQAGVEHSWVLQAGANFQAAAEQCWKVLTLEPRCWAAQISLALAYAEMELQTEAVAELQNAVLCSDRHPLTLGLLSYFSGAHRSAVLAELDQQRAWRYINPLSLAFAHAHDADLSRARDYMRQAVEERDAMLVRMANSSPVRSFGVCLSA